MPEPAFTKKNVLPKNTYEEALQHFGTFTTNLCDAIRHQIQEFRNDQNTDIDEYTGLPYFSENAAIFVMLNQKEAIRASGDTVDVPPQYKLSDYKFIPIPTQPEVTNVSTTRKQHKKKAEHSQFQAIPEWRFQMYENERNQDGLDAIYQAHSAF